MAELVCRAWCRAECRVERIAFSVSCANHPAVTRVPANLPVSTAAVLSYSPHCTVTQRPAIATAVIATRECWDGAR